ncbi:sulfotransferase domain-containing protein [Jannaschia sp. W003]|uniref:sulfotransferase domain-containing protein n=1 Tax=Jannaschia sp. W003 TaxID=2867012 RepID=UPI0021A5C84E|nr:sulfotransferase domain-containing protein [Jannaschia sp. W003]UWQ22030.1 sulfotransferase domain-containing protein [Jannaschia sp. W003]
MIRAFVLLAEMRTGSNHLEASLDALEGVACLGELFNPHFMGAHNRFELDGIDMAARERDPLALLARVVERPGLNGFRLFHDHDPRVVDAVLPDPSVAKIVLGRNPLDAYVSLKIAQATGQWRLTNPKMAKAARATFDGAEFDALCEAQAAFRARVQGTLQRTGQTAFWLDYEDIGTLDVVNGIAAFLGVPARLDALPGTLKRQNPGEAADKVANPEAMAAHLAGLDPFALGRLPGTEPARGAAVPSMMAAGDLLCLPVPGGPTRSLRRWMEHAGEVAEGMNQKALRQWLRGHKGYRSFAVVRHPMARAHAAFAAIASSEGGGPVRRLLVRHYDAPLPERGAAEMDRGTHRAAFEAFLRFAKANLGGQTALPPDPRWGSQLAAIQGMAQVVPPLEILREDEAAAALARIAPEAPPWEGAAEGALRLGDVHDAALEDLALEVWRRDYLTFGFRRRG